MADVFPTAAISRGLGPVTVLPEAPADLREVAVRHPERASQTVGAVMDGSDTDGWMVVHHGRVIAEHYPRMAPDNVHLLMSVSKSLVGSVVGVLIDQGLLALDHPVQHYVPEFATTGYAGATVRDLLDMRSGIRFSEEYLNPDAEVRVLEEAFGWAPRTNDHVPDNLRGYLLTLQADRVHGGRFDYRSCETDVLGWLCEAATGQRFPRLISEVLWARMGAAHDANIGIDSHGTGMFDGGISAAMSDLARFGLLLAHQGASPLGIQVLPGWWVEDTFVGGADSAFAFAQSGDAVYMPGGMYRNQFWFPSADRDVALALGIHGQMIYVNRARDFVGVKVSSWPTPQHADRLFDTIRSFDTICAELG